MANVTYDESGNPILGGPDAIAVEQGLPISAQPVEAVPGGGAIEAEPVTPNPGQAVVGDPTVQSGADITPADKLNAAKIIINHPDLPTDGPGAMIDKKVGENKSETTTETPTEKALQADSLSEKAIQENANAATDAKTAADAEGKAQADKAEAVASADATYLGAVQKVQANNMARAQADLADIDARVAQLASTPPETFWGSKTAAAKVSSAISVGLGSFGQALLGSGQNVGTLILERQMDEFKANQEQKFKTQMEQIKQMRLSYDDKQKLADNLVKQQDAIHLGALAQINGQYARALQMAKTAEVKAAIGKQQAAFDQKSGNEMAQIQQKYATKHSQINTRDIMQQIAATPGVTRDGKPLNEDQSKSLGFYGQMKGALQNIQTLDEGGITQRGVLSDTLRQLEQLAQQEKGSHSLSNLIQSGLNGQGVTPLDQLKQRDPEAYNFFVNAQPFINAQLRKESGAAISNEEYTRAFSQYFPAPQDGPKEIQQKVQRRHDALESMFQSTGQAAGR